MPRIASPSAPNHGTKSSRSNDPIRSEDAPARTFHAKPLLAVANARFEVVGNLTKELRQGFVEAKAEYATTVRLSNASGLHQADTERDLRGIALRVVVSDDEAHDLLMTNFPVPHARDAKQFVAFARAMSGNRILGIVKLVFAVGPVQALRKLRDVVRDSKRPVSQGKN